MQQLAPDGDDDGVSDHGDHDDVDDGDGGQGGMGGEEKEQYEHDHGDVVSDKHIF